ncbi:MAG: repeat protein [Chlorobi bacterium]|nr:repeat protein [Chlorobiota bacterium]
MNKAIISIACLMIFSISGAFGQEWIKAYGGKFSDYGYNIFPEPDGGFITAGGTATGNQQTDQDFWAARFDANGNKIWDKRYGTAGIQETIFGSGATGDHGIMLGGFTGVQFSGTESALMYKIDTTGAVNWNIQIDYSSSDHFHFFVERKEGGYYFGGHTESKGDPQGDMWLIRYDSARNIVWEKTYGHGGSEHAHWGTETRDGGCLLAGHASVGNKEKYWVVKVDSNGTKQWDKIFSSSDTTEDSPYHAFVTKEGNYAIIGGSSLAKSPYTGRIWLLVIDTLGNIIIDKHFGDPLSDSFAWSGRQTSDGGYIMAGYTTHDTKGAEDMYVVKTLSDGTLDWEKTFGGSGSDGGYDVIEVADGYIACGSTDSPSLQTGGNGDMMLVKIKKNVAAPAAVTLISPGSGAHDLAVSLTLSWSSVPGAPRYHLQLSTDSGLASPILDDSTLTATSLFVSLGSYTSYYWRVRAENAGGAGPWSDTWSFQTGENFSVDNASDASAVLLSQNAPNPFGGRTLLRFSLPWRRHARLELLDALGRVVATPAEGDFDGGDHDVTIDGSALPAGVYLARLTVGGDAVSRIIRMTVVH